MLLDINIVLQEIRQEVSSLLVLCEYTFMLYKIHIYILYTAHIIILYLYYLYTYIVHIYIVLATIILRKYISYARSPRPWVRAEKNPCSERNGVIFHVF